MRGIPSSFILLFFAFIFFVELCSYLGIRLLINRLSSKTHRYLFSSYILFSSIVIGLLLYSFSNPDRIRESHNYSLFYVVIFFSILNIFPKTVFAVSTLISYVFRWIAGKTAQLMALMGSFILVTGIFIIIVYGNLCGRKNIVVQSYDLHFNGLPKQLDGLKIVQLSDIHLGSFNKNFKVIQETVKIVNNLKPDLLLFTGDLVNNFSDELTGYEPFFQQLSATYGKFAIQGNHDYGDYSNWPDSTSKKKNLEEIRNGFERCGFELLLNRWIRIEVQDTSFALIGVENWGHPPFPQYAKLDRAMEGIPNHTFRILMSHDPEHWNSIVVPKTDIPLTLSGHTHGGQFGIRIAGIDFSLIYLYQKYWGGLYEADNQYLYVNRGLGTIGYQGRVEMNPEITVLTLHPATNR
jgi:predicted MPP superfamily phosphohydrolase